MKRFLPRLPPAAANLVLALGLAACATKPVDAISLDAAGNDDAIQVMILATYHMGNPGQDLHNARIDPVTTPAKQAQLEAVADALARFHPTAIAVERVAADPATQLDHRYPGFNSADLLTNPDERVQVGYRLAAKLGLSRVYAIDEQDRPGEMSYFPFGLVAAWAQANGRMEALNGMQAVIAAAVSDLETRQDTHTVGQLLADFNAPDSAMGAAGHGFYMQLMAFGAGDDQPGAMLNARWYARNAMIFARLAQVAEPGDRIVVVYGAGHAYWLRHFVEQTPGYRLVEAIDYLPAQHR